jgi:hypothetical protein
MKIFRFTIMMIALAVVGATFAVAGAFIGGRILGSNAEEFGALGLAIGGVLVGYPLGIIVGIVLLKKLFHQSGSLLLGILGAIFGTVATVALSALLNLISNINLLVGAFILIVTGLSVGGLHIKR